MSRPKTWYLPHLDSVSEVAILVGDQRRLNIFAEQLNKSNIVVSHHLFGLLTGEYKNVPLSVVAYGMGAPAVAVALEELATLGAKVVVKAGTAMTLTCPLGSLLLAEGGVRLEGTSYYYLPPEVPAIADHRLLKSFEEMLSALNVSFYTGLIATLDSLHPNRLDHHRLDTPLLSKLGVLGLDMETATIYTVSRFLGLKSVSLCLATVAFHNFETLPEESRYSLERLLVHAVLECVHNLQARG